MTYTPYFVHGEDRPGRWLVTCDHASNLVPPFVNCGDLGLPREDMERHIAYDVGAYGLAQHLGQLLDSPVVASNFSRLVIDPNRGEDDPTLLMKLYDGTLIPANRNADAEETERRLTLCYRPYHEQLARFAALPHAVILSVHSFTRQLRGRDSMQASEFEINSIEDYVCFSYVRHMASLGKKGRKTAGRYEVRFNEDYVQVADVVECRDFVIQRTQ